MRYREEYIQSGGVFCPFCRNEDIEGGSVDVVEGSAFQEVSCLRCGACWNDEYQLVDVSTIHEPEEPEKKGG